MALNLNDHLLKTPDGLVTTLFWHLLSKVVLGPSHRVILGLECSLLVLLELVLVLVGHVRVCSLLEVVGSVGETSLASLLRVIRRVILSIIHCLLAGLLDVASAEWLVLSISVLGLSFQATCGHVRGLMPGIVLGRFVDLVEAVRVRVDLGGCLLSGVTSHVAHQDDGIVEQFAELAIGDDQCAQGAQAIQSLVAMLLRGLFVYRCTWERRVATIQVLSLPEEVLEQVALVFAQEQMLGLLDDIAQISD